MGEQLPLGQPFKSLGERIIYAYLACYPEFVPWPDESSPESQRQLHSFFHDMIDACYQNPELIGITPEPDRCFEERWHLNNRDPELMDTMLKTEKKFLDWVGTLYKLGTLGEARENGLFVSSSAWKLTSKLLERFLQFGLQSEITPGGVLISCKTYPAIFTALKKRSSIAPGHGGQITCLIRFLLGSVPGHFYRATQMFGKLYADSAWLHNLESFFEKLGYTCSNDERWPCVRWEKEYPGKERGYLHITYHWRDRRQMCYEFRVPSFRLLLGHYEEMEYALKELCFIRTKVCDNCGYCTQTDKSGRRQKLALPLKYPDGEMLKCPLWPWFSWNEIDSETIAKMERLFLFAEEKLYGQKS
jgi:hypothetical protein